MGWQKGDGEAFVLETGWASFSLTGPDLCPVKQDRDTLRTQGEELCVK